MNREEILAKSQQENHGQDIANLEVSKNGMKIGWVVIICLLAFVSVVNAIVFERMSSEVFFASQDFPNSNTVSRSSARFFRLYAVACSTCRYSAM